MKLVTSMKTGLSDSHSEKPEAVHRRRTDAALAFALATLEAVSGMVLGPLRIQHQERRRCRSRRRSSRGRRAVPRTGHRSHAARKTQWLDALTKSGSLSLLDKLLESSRFDVSKQEGWRAT